MVRFKKVPAPQKKTIISSLIVLALDSSLGFFVLLMILDKTLLASNHFKQWDWSTFFAAILYAGFQTALAEEIFFRGFLAKRFIKKAGV
jgi:membrane protease YdiL (CAAX protease family)